MKYLYEKTVVVTGASSGIGLELSKQLISDYGCKVIGIGRSVEKLNKAKTSLGDNFTPFSCDVSKKSEWQRLACFLRENEYEPDILINNAGIMLPFIKTENLSEQDFENVFATNFLSILYSLDTVVPLLRKDKGLVNISSSSALCPVIGQSAYSASKSAVKSLTEILQTEEKFYVGLIMPGFCKTDIMRSIKRSEKENKLIDKISISSQKCAKIILKTINKKRKRKIIGLDAKFMNLLHIVMPKSSGKIIAKVLKSSKLNMFEGIQ